MSWITENPKLLLGLAAIFGTVAGTWIGARAGLQIERKRQEFERNQNERRARTPAGEAGLSFAATPGPGDSDGGDVYSP